MLHKTAYVSGNYVIALSLMQSHQKSRKNCILDVNVLSLMIAQYIASVTLIDDLTVLKKPSKD
jgi:hypothetical protein